jgi:hypothetical protein
VVKVAPVEEVEVTEETAEVLLMALEVACADDEAAFEDALF